MKKNKAPCSFKSMWNSITSNFILWFGIGSATEFSTIEKRYFCTTVWFLWAIKDQNEFEWRELIVAKVVQTAKGCLLCFRVIWITFAINFKNTNLAGLLNRKIKDIFWVGPLKLWLCKIWCKWICKIVANNANDEEGLWFCWPSPFVNW